MGALPDAAASSPGIRSSRQTVSRIWPQGWGFFTKSPRTPANVAYKITEGDAPKNALIGPNASPSNLFGASRRARAQGPEIATLLHSLPERAWKKCEAYVITECEADDFTLASRVVNSSPIPTLCGKVILTSEEPVPWAWRTIAKHQYRITKTAVVNIQC
ncbi:SdpA family antimicrobial peptide system protein [Streptomyces sp. SAS_267]|uniref:SdpA family antimicrobial peptide system protein n=1 Tax=Streptomyces sp. SAS_267 TaxID=3412750 RepID=UPI00403C6633